MEVVSSAKGGKLAPKDRRNFHDAELIGITVEQTFWSVWLPDSRALTKSDGNMEEVVAVAREVEKARSAVDELAALSRSVVAGNRSGNVEISENAIDALLFSMPQGAATQPVAPPATALPASTSTPRTTMSFSTANGGTVRMGVNGNGALAAADVAGNVGAMGNAPENAEQKALQQLGRLSLAVDFPVQGHVHHFQKAKASAVIEVSFADPGIAQRWVRIGIFAGLAALLAFAGRVFAGRRMRHGA